jgi:hypothetical protein
MVISVNGNVGVSDSVLSGSIAAVDTNCKGGVTVEDHNDESEVTVTNSNGEAITAEVVEREGKICENGSGSEENNVNDNDFVIAEGGGELKGCAAKKQAKTRIAKKKKRRWIAERERICVLLLFKEDLFRRRSIRSKRICVLIVAEREKRNEPVEKEKERTSGERKGTKAERRNKEEG